MVLGAGWKVEEKLHTMRWFEPQNSVHIYLKADLTYVMQNL